MDIDVFPDRELPTVMRVLRTALCPDGPMQARDRAFLATYARIAGCEAPATDPPPIAADEVRIDGNHQRKRMLQLSALAVLLCRPVRGDALDFLKALALHLGTHDGIVEVIDALHKGQHMKVRMLAMRRMFAVMFKEAYAAEGLKGVLRFAGAMLFKTAVNKDKQWRYKRLGLLPEGTLGREYWKHMTTVGFTFPGEPAGIPDSVAYHDIGHVLAEHEATSLGEIQQGSFQGGNRREGGLFFIQFVILQFHHGIKVSPAAPTDVGHFDPEKVLWAIHRGAKCRVDMTHRWDYWPLMPLPLAEARARCGLIPKAVDGVGIRRVA